MGKHVSPDTTVQKLFTHVMSYKQLVFLYSTVAFVLCLHKPFKFKAVRLLQCLTKLEVSFDLVKLVKKFLELRILPYIKCTSEEKYKKEAFCGAF